ncbi:hypothetical protein [Nonomuraea endophytica]|uniref:Band 7 domain-containing protein n=1 Tax=Nonomuraea endophytica TaxID=714136 RepID=A0A7W8EK43_9ACTN|nr:hypothetical protein [Nonomuraea endophytica]MBB5081327.1 hypothetical protein [Nonomuraea endophytica]
MTRKYIPAAILALAALTACSVTTETNEQAIDYDYDMFSGTTKKESCVAPGQRSMLDINDYGVVLPADLRTFEFAGSADPKNPNAVVVKEGAETGPITVSAAGNITMLVSGVASFNLTTDCATLDEFWRNIGRKYAADTPDGWRRMLSVVVQQPLDRAMDAAAKAYTWEQLSGDNTVKQNWEKAVADSLPGFIQEQTGKQYFTNFKLTLQMPMAPPSLQDAKTAKEVANQRNEAQKAENTRALTELDQIKALKDVLGIEGAVLWRAVEKGQLQVYVTGDGKVNVTPGKP